MVGETTAEQWHGDISQPESTGTSPVDVVVDDRERGSGVVEHLSDAVGLRVTVRRMNLGDYLLNNRILVERKTITDFAVSIADGRLFTQACRMVEERYVPVLVIEGAMGDGGFGGMAREAIQGAMVSLTLFLGIPCLRSRDPPETARLLRFTAEQMRRRMVRTVYRHGYRPKGARKRQLFILQGLPGVGPARAERLLDSFGSVEAVFTASVEELAEINGMGQTTAEKIRNLIASSQTTDPHRLVGVRPSRDTIIRRRPGCATIREAPG